MCIRDSQVSLYANDSDAGLIPLHALVIRRRRSSGEVTGSLNPAYTVCLRYPTESSPVVLSRVNAQAMEMDQIFRSIFPERFCRGSSIMCWAPIMLVIY